MMELFGRLNNVEMRSFLFFFFKTRLERRAHVPIACAPTCTASMKIFRQLANSIDEHGDTDGNVVGSVAVEQKADLVLDGRGPSRRTLECVHV